MRELLADLYNKVVNFFQPEREVTSKEIASNRLKLVLMQDRTNLDASTLEKMRIELVEVISKYVEIDKEEFGVNLEGVGESIALMLNIPVIRAKTPEEIEAALNNQEENIENEEETEEQVSDCDADVENFENTETQQEEVVENSESNNSEN